MRALIVDDSRSARGYLREMLEERGIECEEAGDGQAGIDLLHAGRRFEVALVDWNMPAMNGLEMLKQLRLRGCEGMKVIMVSGAAENEFILRALDAGADEYLMKPFDEAALGDKLVLLGLAEA
jgi:two-component system chemotaxis response regulator CheY